MSLHARTLDDILSPKSPKSGGWWWRNLLFKRSSATFDASDMNEMLQIRAALGPAPILGLPTELLWKIFTLLPKQDQNSFRLLDKQLSNSVKHLFAKTLPSTWRFVFTQDSLKGLVNLTADSDFLPMCESISFGTSRLESVEEPGLDHNDPEYSSKTRTRQELSTIAHKKRAQISFLLGGRHVEALLKALDNLQNNGRTDITLGVHDDTWHQVHAFALDVFIGRAYGNSNLVTRDIANTLTALGIAIKHTKFPVKQIRLDVRFDPLGVKSEHMFWETLDPIPDVIIEMSDESVVDISVSRSELRLSHHSLASGRYWCGFTERSHEAIYNTATNGQYRKLSMDNIEAHHGFLSSFLGDDVTEIEMSEIYFESREDPPVEFFESLKEMPKLESLKLDGICNWNMNFAWKGQEEIQAGLDEVIEEIKTWGD